VGRLYDATWGRLFAAVYDRLIGGTEEAVLREMRAELLSQASGRTIDVGAGTGANVPLFPTAVTELVLAEPGEHMARQMRRKVAEAGRPAQIVAAPAEDLPFEDSTFDTAIFTLVLCTTPDPGAALAEAARVLRPGGRMLFIEHVRAEDPRLARWQDRLETPWRLCADGCHCNRDTLATIQASPLEVDEVSHDQMLKAPPILRPLLVGSAHLPA
jgi:ubiquinone/menaquinone biosynthesis C-methylase UbiE